MSPRNLTAPMCRAAEKHPAEIARSAGTQAAATAHRSSSAVTRVVSDRRVLFVKQYLESDWGNTAEVIRARTARECRLLQSLGDSGLFHGRHGLVPLVDADLERCVLVMEEVSGQDLDKVLERGSGADARRDTYRAVYLAGQWLRKFQSISVQEADKSPISHHDQTDVVGYCTYRMDRLREAGYSWPTERFEEELRQVLGQAARSDGAGHVLTHGDYSPGNILWDGRTLTPIDFGMAHYDHPFADVTYFLHRLEMMSVYRPWRRWPVAKWRRAFLEGYDCRDAEQSPMYRACMIRHLLCRVLTYVLRPPRDRIQAMHNCWVRWQARRRVERLCHELSGK